MSFERLKEAILAEAAARRGAIQEHHQQKLMAERTRIKKAARALEEHIITAAEQEGVAAARRLRQEQQLTAKARVLTAKQAELTATQTAAAQRILDWDAAHTTKLLKKLLALLPDEPGTIIPGKTHQEQLKKLVPSKYTVSTKTVPGGGFIYQAAHSEINLTIEHLVQQLFSRHRAEIAKELFS